MENITTNTENIVVHLREKTEAADMNKYLKGTFGGYTKKSVQEYFSLLRKQHQTAQDNFKRNLETVFQEKESLRNDYDIILARCNKLSLEYENLTESIKTIELENCDCSPEAFLLLQKTTVALEEELKKSNNEKEKLSTKINQLNKENADLKLSLELANKEIEAQKQLLLAEKQESRKLRDEIITISRMLEEEKNEVKYLKGIISEAKCTELNSKISELSEQLSAITEVAKIKNLENSVKEQTINSLNDEISLLNQRLSLVEKSEQSLNLQNNKLLSANEALKMSLEQEYKKSINLVNEKSNIVVDKLIAEQNLRDIEAKLAAMEISLKTKEQFSI